MSDDEINTKLQSHSQDDFTVWRFKLSLSNETYSTFIRESVKSNMTMW